jgi:hypothetical protein
LERHEGGSYALQEPAEQHRREVFLMRLRFEHVQSGSKMLLQDGLLQVEVLGPETDEAQNSYFASTIRKPQT